MNKIVVFRIVVGLAAVTAAVSLARPAAAQFSVPGMDLNGPTRHYTPEEKQKMEEIDKNYKATMKKVPDKQKTYDPWAGARQDSSNGSTTKR